MWLMSAIRSADHHNCCYRDDHQSQMLPQFSLHLDRPNGQYSVGEQLSGKIRFAPPTNHILTKASTLNTIQIQFYGEAKICTGLFRSIRFGHYGQHRLSKHRGRSHHEIIITEMISFKHGVTWPKIMMNYVEIPFIFTIPHHLPGSLNHSPQCYIRYQLIATTGHKSQNDQHLEIIIHSNPNTSYNRLCEPVIMSCNRNIGWIYSKMVRIRCELPCTGFKLGTEIPIKCMIDNRSTKSLSLEIKLTQKILLLMNKSRNGCTNTRPPTVQRIHRTELLNKFVTDIEPYCIVQHITTLPLPETGLPIVHNTSKLIQIIYEVNVELKIPWHNNLRCKLPVILTNDSKINFQRQTHRNRRELN